MLFYAVCMLFVCCFYTNKKLTIVHMKMVFDLSGSSTYYIQMIFLC